MPGCRFEGMLLACSLSFSIVSMLCFSEFDVQDTPVVSSWCRQCEGCLVRLQLKPTNFEHSSLVEEDVSWIFVEALYNCQAFELKVLHEVAKTIDMNICTYPLSKLSFDYSIEKPNDMYKLSMQWSR